MKKSVKLIVSLFKSNRAFFITALSILMTVGCQKNDDTSKSDLIRSASAQLSENGGIDGSGGSTLKSSEQEFTAALNSAHSGLKTKLMNLEVNLKKQSEQDFDNAYGLGAYQLIYDLMSYDNSVSKLIASLDASSISITSMMFSENVTTATCLGMDAKKYAGIAVGDLNSGGVCIVGDHFLKLPPHSLEKEITLVLVHELSHLVGFNEERAMKLQKLIGTYPEILN